MKSIITGGAGFIGSHLAKKLIEQGHEVVIIDNLSTGHKENLKEIEDNEKFTFIKGEAKDIKTLLEHHSDIDWIFHYAAVVGVERTNDNPFSVLDDVLSIRAITHFAKERKVKKVIYASSSEVYGEPVEIPSPEEGTINANTPYAVTKMMGEKYFQTLAEKTEIKTYSLRFFNVYGPNQRASKDGFVVGAFIEQALEAKPFTIIGDGSQTRDFMFIEDNINASLKVITTPELSGKAINIGTGRERTINELAQTIAQVLSREVESTTLPYRKGEVIKRCPKVELLESTGFKPQFTLLEGLTITIKSIRNK